MKVKCAMALLTCITVFALSANVVQAATAMRGTLTLVDSNGMQKVVFVYPETVTIKWAADGTVDIIVTCDDTGEVILELKDKESKGEFTFQPPYVGNYTVCAYGQNSKLTALGTFFYIPESIFGALMSMAVGSAAFGVFRFSRIKRFNR